MSSLSSDLLRSPVFGRVPRSALDASAPLWSVRKLASGETFCREGDAGDSVALLTEGACSVSINGVNVGRVGHGELVGEVSAFFSDNVRSATLVAEGATTLHTLSTAGLARLRAEQSPVYAALLKRALEELGKRVVRANDKLSRLVEGTHERPVRKDPSAFVKLWRTLVPGKPPRPCPPIHPLLRALPRLKGADPGTLLQLSVAFEAKPLAEGEILFLEQDPADSAWILADGQIDVLRQVRGTRAERLAQMNPGDLFGVNALVTGGVRTASCVAATPGWAYRLSSETHNGLKGATAIWWQESILTTMQAQLRLASGNLERAISGPPPEPPPPPAEEPGGPTPAASEDDALSALLEQSGYLEGLPAGLNLDELELVVDEDQKRNRRV